MYITAPVRMCYGLVKNRENGQFETIAGFVTIACSRKSSREGGGGVKVLKSVKSQSLSSFKVCQARMGLGLKATRLFRRDFLLGDLWSNQQLRLLERAVC
jgi:hypothetical protein